MPISNSDIITSQIIREELGLGPGTPFTLGGSEVRDLTGIPSGPINIPNDFKGKSAIPVLPENSYLINSKSSPSSTNVNGYSIYHDPSFGSIAEPKIFKGHVVSGFFSLDMNGQKNIYVAILRKDGIDPPDSILNTFTALGVTHNYADRVGSYMLSDSRIYRWILDANASLFEPDVTYQIDLT